MTVKFHFADKLKRESAAQIIESRHSSEKVTKQLEGSQHSLYTRKNKFFGSKGASKDKRDTEIRSLMSELDQATKDRDILKRVTA